MKRVLLIGDSIRMGYQPIVQRELQGVAEVYGPEQNGGTSRNVRQNLQAWALASAPDLVHVNCGLHDIKKPLDSDAIEISLDEYRENVRDILQRLKNSGATVIWATTTPVIGERHHAIKGFDRWEPDVDTYNEVALAIARELEVPVDDLFSVVMQAGKAELLTSDGVHYTPEGSELLGKAVAEFVRARL
jgi:lysophospholipase L1-like esterase